MTAMGGRPYGNSTLCPHCGAPCYTHNTTQVTPTYRRIRYGCSDQECGHIFVAEVNALYTLLPSAKPNHSVILPLRGPAGDDQAQLDIFKTSGDSKC